MTYYIMIKILFLFLLWTNRMAHMARNLCTIPMKYRAILKLAIHFIKLIILMKTFILNGWKQLIVQENTTLGRMMPQEHFLIIFKQVIHCYVLNRIMPQSWFFQVSNQVQFKKILNSKFWNVRTTVI